MKTKIPNFGPAFVTLTMLMIAGVHPGHAQGTAFTYQGRLNNGTNAAHGTYNLTFSLFDTGSGGSPVAGPVTNNAVVVTNGLFTVLIDFGADAFTGGTNWLQIGVQTNGAGSFTTLSPRQELTPTPYAIYAASAGGVLSGLTVQLNTNGAPNVIGGSSVNSVSTGVIGATIGGGGAVNYQGVAYTNSVTMIFGTVGGGRNNRASGDSATVGGGFDNTAGKDSATVGGGYNNVASNGSTTVAGGFDNIASGNVATVGGGGHNTASGNYSTVPGGFGNSATNAFAAIGGGQINLAGGNSSTISGGFTNVASADFSTVGGGEVNANNSPYATIGGGGFNFIGTNSNSGTISGGFANQIATNTHDATIGGGSYGSIGTNSFASTIAGGSHNSIGNNANVAAIGGGANNTASGMASTVGGGEGNTATNSYATVGGGYYNVASGNAATVVGGYSNIASAPLSIAMGWGNTASGFGSSTAMGVGTTASDFAATAMGDATTASSEYSTAMGYHTTASGLISTAMGDYTTASGVGSTAMGHNAMAVNDESFVWNDGSLGFFSSTTTNQFAVQAAGGVLLAADIQMGTNASDYHHFTLGGGNSSGYLYGSYPAFGDGIHLGYNIYYGANGQGHIANPGGATSRITAGYGVIKLDIGGVNAQPTIDRLVADSTGVAVYGTFNNSSDRNAKQDFAPVSVSKILDKVLQLPVSEWSYKTDAGTRHLGPMGQDFYSVFNLGTDEKHIAPIDEGGVALAAIQGLNQKVEEKEVRIQEQAGEIQDLKTRLEKLEQLLNQKTGGVK